MPKRITEEELVHLGFEKRTTINPRPAGRKDYAYTDTSLFLTVWDGGDWDGELMMDYSGGNITIQDVSHLKRLCNVIDEGHGKRPRFDLIIDR